MTCILDLYLQVMTPGFFLMCNYFFGSRNNMSVLLTV